jgi:hypothetical protein
MIKGFEAILAAALFMSASSASAVVITSTNTAQFNLTAENFADQSAGPFVTADLVSFSGNLSIDNLGSTLANSHKFSQLTPLLAGVEYIKNGEEDFDLKFTSLQNAFAMNYVDQSAISTFSLNFFDGLTNVGSTSFVTASINSAEFIGFSSSVAFDRVEIRETDTGGGTNELFQFYTAEAVPEPGALAIFGLGLLGLGYMRRRKAA